MFEINLIPLSSVNKKNLEDLFYEEVNINEILCYENIVYRNENNDPIAKDTVEIGKVNEFGETPEDYEEKQEEEVYFSYAITLPIFSLQEKQKFIDFSYILDNSTLDDIEEYFGTTDNLLLVYHSIKKTFRCTIAEKEKVEEYKDGILKKHLLIDENNFDRERFQELLNGGCIMTNVLNRCIELINETEERHDSYAENKMCLACLTDSFKGSKNDTYSCLEKLAYYAIYYGPMYVSEIYHFLKESQIIENNFLGLKRPINIMSLGCGFGPDNIALHKHCKDKWLDVEYNYKGYDIEPLWGEISSAVMQNVPELKNIVEDEFDCRETDIIFMNKVFSTLKNNGLHEDFLSNFRDQLDDFPIGSLIIYNDINHYDTRDKFEKFMLQNSFKCNQKYYAYNSYGDDWIKLENTNNIIDVPEGLPISPRSDSVDLVFYVYEKIEEN
jgi:hypothetical protein